MNVAVGLARLGVPVLLITELAEDAHGSRVLAHLCDNEVDLVVAPPRSGRTSTATARLDSTGAATYEFALTWSLAEHQLPDCDGLHLGSLGAALEPGRTAVLDLQRRAVARNLFVSYDPNIRPGLQPDPEHAWTSVRSIADGCNLVKLSDEDAGFLQPGVTLDQVAESLLDGSHTQIVVVSRGSVGATAYAPGVRVEVPVPPTKVVDTVGAGDALMAGLLSILFERGAMTRHAQVDVPVTAGPLVTLLQAAAFVAAETVARRGANPPTRAELPDHWPGLSPH